MGTTVIITHTFILSVPLSKTHTYTALRWCPVSQEMMVRIHLPTQVHPLHDLRGFINYTALGPLGTTWRVWVLLDWLQGVPPDLTRSWLCSSQFSSSPKLISPSCFTALCFLSVLFVSLRTDFNFLVSTSGQLQNRKEELAALLNKAWLFIQHHFVSAKAEMLNDGVEVDLLPQYFKSSSNPGSGPPSVGGCKFIIT